MIAKQHLPEQWTLQATGDLIHAPDNVRGRDIPASVPGCVHTDLLAAALIPDPYLDRNELKVQWIGRTDWQYTCAFDVAGTLLAHERVELVCEGLDTVARLELNGQTIGETANMHLRYTIDVKPFLQPGRNRLVITFASALGYAEHMRDRLGNLPHTEKHPYNFIRKMACNFGWDWGPTLITAGVWRPIYLQAWDTARLEVVRPLVTQAEAAAATVQTLVDLARHGSNPLSVTVRLTDATGEVVCEASAQVAAGAGQGSVTCQISDPALWWPRGYGEQPLYGVTVTLTDEVTGTELDNWNGRIGLRTIRLNTEADEIGSKFVLEVNGRPIFCKGTDWIPDDCFPTRVDEARYRRRIEQAIAANMNMLRVWGGGLYEDEAFYQLCDERGVMVWQDFLFACAAYPEASPFWEMVEAEARYQIARLSPHASLVLWNGNNENIVGYFDWGWQSVIGDRAWGLGYYLDLLPRLVGELDPTRPYWPASPYSGAMDIHPNLDNHGNTHLWTVWHGGNYEIYRNHTPRFTSEFGFQGPANVATLKRALPAEQLFPDSPALQHHQKSRGGDEKNRRFLVDYFNVPADFADWHYLMQLNQARALTCAVEWFRSRQPVCMGTLYWQLNDCWPVTSWAAIDGDGRPRLLWYASRRFYAGRLLTFQPEADRLVLFANNDSDDIWQADVSLARLNFAGHRLATWQVEVAVPPRGCVHVLELDRHFYRPEDPAQELIVATTPEAQAFWFFEVDKKLAYPRPQFTAHLERDGASHELTIKADSLLRDVALFPDYLDPEATVSEQLVTLLPDETFTFVIESERAITLDELIKPPVLQCANYFGR